MQLTMDQPAPAAKTDSRPLVLVVEDDDQVVRLMEFVLGEDGYTVRHAASCAEARRLMAELAAPALVSLDILLPDGSGTDLIVDVRSKPGWERVPIMMVTVKEKAQGSNWAVKAGARAYIVKPFKIEDLRAAVARLVNKKTA